MMMSLNDLAAIARTVQGIPVWGLLGESPAAKAGIRYGDVILSVNGMRTPTIDEYLVAMDLDEGGLRRFIVYRAGEELSVDVPVRRLDTQDAEAAVHEVVDRGLLPRSDRASPSRLA